MNDEEQTLPLCDNCLVATTRKTGRAPIATAGMLLLFAGVIALIVVNYWGRAAEPAGPDPDFERIRSGLKNVGCALPDYGLGIMAVIAALIIAIVVSIGQNAQQLRRLEEENAATHRTDLSALGKIQAMSTSLGAELMIAGLCMILIMILAIAALVAGGAGPDMFGITCLASAGWLAFQLGHVFALHSAAADVRTAFDTALTRKMRGRVDDINKGERRPNLIRKMRRRVGGSDEGDGSDEVVRWPILIWWGLYLGLLVGVTLWLSEPAANETAAMREQAILTQLFALVVAAGLGTVTQMMVSAAANAALTDDGASRSLTIVWACPAGLAPGLLCSVAITTAAPKADITDHTPQLLVLLGGHLILSLLLSMGVAGKRPLRAAARRYTRRLSPQPRTAGRHKPSTRTGTVLAWGTVVAGIGVPSGLAWCAPEMVATGAGMALALGLVTVMALRVAGYALFSEREERTAAAVLAVLVAVGGSLVAGLLLGSDQCWRGVVGGLSYAAATILACIWVVDQRQGGALSRPFIALQARREEPVRRLMELGETRQTKNRCTDPTCRNYRGDAGKDETEGEEAGGKSPDRREAGREGARRKRQCVLAMVLIGMMILQSMPYEGGAESGRSAGSDHGRLRGGEGAKRVRSAAGAGHPDRP